MVNQNTLTPASSQTGHDAYDGEDDNQVFIELDRIVELVRRRGDHISHLVRLGVRSFTCLMLHPICSGGWLQSYPSLTQYDGNTTYSSETLLEVFDHQFELSAKIYHFVRDAIRGTAVAEQDLLFWLEVEIGGPQGLKSVVARMRAMRPGDDAPTIEFRPAQEEE